MTTRTRYEQRDGIARLTLARPETGNALDDPMIEEASTALAVAGRDEGVRAVILDAAGKTFCAGTDVTWMELAARGRDADDLFRLGTLLQAFRTCPKPVIAAIQGPAIGAGAALAACADVAICADDVFFQFPAVRLGTIPAVIGPYVIEAIGQRQAHRYLLTGEAFYAQTAQRIGLVHEVCPLAELAGTVEQVAAAAALGGPVAVKEAKALLVARGHEAPSPSLLREAARKSTEVRRSDEGREGLAAFVERRPPSWRG